MIYTNVHIPNFNSIENLQAKKIAELELLVKLSENKVRHLEGILDNIPAAVREYGYVDINIDSKNKITLIEKKPDA